MTTPPPYTPSDGEYPSYATPPSSPKRSKKPWIFGGLGIVVILIIIASVSGNSGDKETSAATASSTVTALSTTTTPSTVTVTVQPTTTRPPAPAAAAPAPSNTTSAPAAPAPAAAVMPAVVCMNLQAAQDLIQQNGVFFSRSDDATGAGRMQIIDRNWIVVSQTPLPGEPVTEAEAVLSVVKDNEPNNC